MDAFTRKLALRNAAKVALGSMFFGCGGALTADAGAPDAKADSPPHDASVVDVAAEASLPDAALACTGPTEVDASDVGEDAFQCCVALVRQDVGDASLWTNDGADASAVANDPSATNCCHAIVARLDHEPDGGDWSGDFGAVTDGTLLLPWCCDVAYEQGPACTPWGPPTPPEFFDAMELG